MILIWKTEINIKKTTIIRHVGKFGIRFFKTKAQYNAFYVTNINLKFEWKKIRQAINEVYRIIIYI